MAYPKRFLEGKTAIITGASTGIGAAVARILADAGVNLVIAARTAERLEAVRDELIEQTGVRVISVPTDVGIASDNDRLIAATLAEFGGFEILVNNAGIDAYRPFHELPDEEIHHTFAVNLVGATLLTRRAIPHLLRNPWSHVVNMASTAGKFAPPYGAVYAASKAGLVSLTQSLRLEYRSGGLRASAICPGFTESGGIYDRLKGDVGRGTPWVIGSTTADAVARATLKAILHDTPEVIVNTPPVRPFLTAAVAFPRLGEWLFRKFASSFFRRIGRARRQGEPLRRRQRAA